MAAQEMHAAGAAPHRLDHRSLVRDRQVERLREGRGHDDERQAVARSGRERLRRVPRGGGIVLEPELILRVERVEQSLVQPLVHQGTRHLVFYVALHLIAQREHVLCADALGGSGEQMVAEQSRGRLRHRCVGARREQQAQP